MEIAHPCKLKILCDKPFRPWGISMKAKFFLFMLLCIKAATIPLHRYDTEKIRMQCKFKEFFAHPMPLKCISGLFSFLLFFICFFFIKFDRHITCLTPPWMTSINGLELVDLYSMPILAQKRKGIQRVWRTYKSFLHFHISSSRFCWHTLPLYRFFWNFSQFKKKAAVWFKDQEPLWLMCLLHG